MILLNILDSGSAVGAGGGGGLEVEVSFGAAGGSEESFRFRGFWRSFSGSELRTASGGGFAALGGAFRARRRAPKTVANIPYQALPCHSHAADKLCCLPE